MGQALGYRVVSLQRVRIMHITLDSLRPGQWKNLTEQERLKLFRALGKPETGGMRS